LVDNIDDEITKIKKLSFNGECIKYSDGKEVPGEIELLGVNHTSTVYNAIINNEKPFYVYPLSPIALGDTKQMLHEFQGSFEEETSNKLIEFFKIVRKYNYLNGWEIDKTLSAFCIKNQIPEDKIYYIFKQVYGDEYDEKATTYIIEHSKENQDRIPGIGSIVYHAKNLANSRLLSNEEAKLIKDFYTNIIKYKKDQDEIELPDYLIGAEYIYLISSRKKFSEKRGTYFKEKYFVERFNLENGVKEVLYVELESGIPNAIYKPHLLLNDPEPIGVKTEILRFLKERKKAVELLINDEFIYTTTHNFERVEEIAAEIASECFDYVGHFDISLFHKYLAVKISEYRKKHGGKPTPCRISKITGWDENYTMFFHHNLNDEKHELSKDNTLYKYHKAESFNQKEQHGLVYKLLDEGKLLGALLTVSAASILLKPLRLQPVTCVLTGAPGAGKTIASLIATSLFYKSDEIFITAQTTKVGFELTLSSLNSLSFAIDEGALADIGISLKHIIFSVASKRGRTRGRKDLTVDTTNIISNVFWTTETSDLDDIRRSGAFRRVINFVVENWEQFTKLIDLEKEQLPNELYAGCGVDYIKFVLENLERIKNRFERETQGFGVKYKEITSIAETLYAGIILLEEFYTQYYNIQQQIIFKELRREANNILDEVKRTFLSSKGDIVSELKQYLYANSNRLGVAEQVKDINGGFKYVTKEPSSKEMLGEYDKTTKTYYITTSGFKTIAKELEKEKTILINALTKAGVLVKNEKDNSYTSSIYSKITKGSIRVYTIKFPEDSPLDQPPQEPPPEEPPPDNNQTDVIDDKLIDAFSKTTYEPKPQLDTNNKQIEPKSEEKPKETTKETARKPTKPKEKEKAHTQEKEKEEAKEDKDKIIINEDTLNIIDDIKPHNEIPKYEIPKKDIKAFSELVIGSFDIETTGLEETDQILAIAFNTYKDGNLQDHHRFYLSKYNDDETKMVNAFLDALKESNIDVLTGYNLYDFDLKMVKAKDKKNRIKIDYIVNISNAEFNKKPLQGYCIYVDNKYIEVIDAFHLVIKYDNVARSIPAQNYSLKAVAKHFGISKNDRVILGSDEIKESFINDRERFDAYLDEDVREAYEIFKKLAPPYYYIRSIVPFDISFFEAFRSSTAFIWQKILENYYDDEYVSVLPADEKKKYEGGLVVNHDGLYKNVFKIDVASLYPNIMLNYQIHSRKDKKKIALSILNEYTNLRLELKKKAKGGDKEADLIQNALKILINSLYGFYGTGGYKFNDMEASAKVTAYGRKILRFMIEFVKNHDGIIIEADTDGIFFSSVNGEEIYNELRKELNKINFDIELEYKDCIMYASDKKNYIIIEPNGNVKKRGAKYVGRDKNKLWTDFVVEYIKRYVDDPAKAEAFKKDIRDLIATNKAFDWVKVTKKVAKNEVNIINDAKAKGINLSPGSIVTCAYKNYRNKKFVFEGENTAIYDVKYYLSEFEKLVKEIDEVIKGKNKS